MPDQHSPLVRLVEDIETLRIRVDELERRVNAVFKEVDRQLANSKGSHVDDSRQNSHCPVVT